MKKIEENSIYRYHSKRSIRYNIHNFNDRVADIVETIRIKLYDECNIKDFVVSKKYRDCNGIFLISEGFKIVIDMTHKSGHANKRLEIKCKKFNYKIFYYSHRNTDSTTLLDNINSYKKSFNEFIEKVAVNLETKLPKSEKWFRDKIKAEDIYSQLEFTYNRAFKKFIYDVISFKYNIVIEIDGSIHDSIEQKERDSEKDRITKTYGFLIFRVKAFDELSYKDCIENLTKILNYKRYKKNPPRSVKGNPKAILRKSQF